MANPSISTNNGGQVIPSILELVALGNEAVQKGSVYVIDGIQDKVSLPRLTNSDDVLQDRQALPTTPSNALAYTERQIIPLDVMYYDKFNPRLFESVWKEFQPSGPLVDKVTDPDMQRAIISVVSKSINKQVGKLIWQGNVSAGSSSPLRFFDGFITKALADGSVSNPTPAGNITSSNVIAVMDAVDAEIPDALYDDQDFIFHMSTKNFRDYQTAVKNLTYKGQGPADLVPAIYKGREIRYYSGFPENYVLACKASTTPDSALMAAVDMVNDPENIKIERWRPEGEEFFIKVLFKMAVNYPFSQELILYKPA
jgi:hypothetical protein